MHKKTDEVETASPWQKAEWTLAATLATRMGLAQRNNAGNDECQLAWVCSLAWFPCCMNPCGLRSGT